MDIEQLDIESLRELAVTVAEVLDSRTHRRKYLGEEILVKSSLSQALHLPEIQKRLGAGDENKQAQGHDEMIRLWHSLSEATRQTVIDRLGWYDPYELDWDDPRSNRRPPVSVNKKDTDKS